MMNRRPYKHVPKDTWWDNFVCHPFWVVRAETQIEAMLLILGVLAVRFTVG